jgi:DNA-binding response OmpR family regulator
MCCWQKRPYIAQLGQAVCCVEAVASSVVQSLHDAELHVDLIRRNATCNGKDLKLISKECDVLVELMQHESEALSYDQLFESCSDFPNGLNQEDRKKRVSYIVTRLVTRSGGLAQTSNHVGRTD